MSSETNDTIFTLSESYRVEFTAYAPLHTFKGWTVEGVTAAMGIDFEARTITFAHATAKTKYFDTGFDDRNKAMQEFMKIDSLPEASIEMTELTSFTPVDKNRFKISVLAVLEFMGERRQLPIHFTATLTDTDELTIELDFKWSFKAFGIKAPRLLFLTVRDIVDISGHGTFVPATE